jgi:hypothetical protein
MNSLLQKRTSSCSCFPFRMFMIHCLLGRCISCVTKALIWELSCISGVSATKV